MKTSERKARALRESVRYALKGGRDNKQSQKGVDESATIDAKPTAVELARII